MLRILAGEFRSRQLQSPPDADTTRPYIARVRESVCGMLQGWFEEATVLDLFSGVGTMGLECVSRGARHVLMVEHDRKIFGLLEANIETLDCGDRVTAVMGDAVGSACLLRAESPVDLVFIDPPYAMLEDEGSRRRVLDQAERCREVMADSSFLVLRSPIGPKDGDFALQGFDGPEAHRYGPKMWVLMYAPTGAGTAGDAADD
jgi:16S rRNA (guanine(966)-N(2))-methyltransferase RsmD